MVEAEAKELSRRHDVTVVTTNAADRMHDFSRVPSIEDSNGYRIIRYPRLPIFGSLNVSPAMLCLLRQMPVAFDIVHVHSWRQFQDIAVHHYAVKSGTPYVLQALGSLPRIAPKRRLKLVYDLLFGYEALRDASRVIALSEIEAWQYRSMGVPGEKIAIIRNGIDLSEYASLPPKGSFKRKFGIRDDEKIVLYLGRIHTGKGIGFLVKSFAHLITDGTRNVKLVIAGPDDGYLKDVIRLTDALGLRDSVTCPGLLSDQERKEAYVDAEVVVNVEPTNVYGLVPLEAAACSTPVIVSKGNAIAEVVHRGDFGFSVDYDDIGDLASKCKALLNDEDLRSRLGSQGRAFVTRELNWSKNVEELEDLYHRIARS